MNNMKKLVSSTKEFIITNYKGTIILLVSLLVMGIANTFLLPYVITAIMNGHQAEWFEYMLGAVLATAAAVGLGWSAYLLCYQKKAHKTPLRFLGWIVGYAVCAALLCVLFSTIVGVIGTAWYYIIKNIIYAKLAIDITARLLAVPLIALLLCLFGNVVTVRNPLWKISLNRFCTSMLIAAIYAIVEYLLVLPISTTWLLVFICILDSVMYTAMVVLSIILCKNEIADGEKKSTASKTIKTAE